MGSTFNGLIGLIILALDIWAIINVLKSGASTGMKIVWVLLILLLPVLGLQAQVQPRVCWRLEHTAILLLPTASRH